MVFFARPPRLLRAIIATYPQTRSKPYFAGISSTVYQWAIIEELDKKWHVLDHVLQDIATYKGRVLSAVDLERKTNPVRTLSNARPPLRSSLTLLHRYDDLPTIVYAVWSSLFGSVLLNGVCYGFLAIFSYVLLEGHGTIVKEKTT